MNNALEENKHSIEIKPSTPRGKISYLTQSTGQNVYSTSHENESLNLLSDSDKNLSIFNKKVEISEEIFPIKNMGQCKLESFKIEKSSHKAITAAIVALYNYDQYQGTQLIQNIIYPLNKNPYKKTHFDPQKNPYFVKICVNGAFRRVSISLPEPNKSKKKSELSCYFDYESSPLKIERYIWPSLLDRAIKKLYFGSEEGVSNDKHRGNELTVSRNIESNTQTQDNSINSKLKTNPSIEVYHLSGWLPEYMSLSLIDDYEDLWERLYENYSEGNSIFFL